MGAKLSRVTYLQVIYISMQKVKPCSYDRLIKVKSSHQTYFYNNTTSNVSFPAGNCMFKVNNRNTRTRCEIRHWRRSGIFIVNFEHISHLVLMFLLLTLSR